MSVKCQAIMDALYSLAPAQLAEKWDNVGLLVGSPSQKIKKILVVLDVTLPVIDYAAANQIDMIIAHHPLIFHPLKSIRTDRPGGIMLAKLLQNEIAVFAAHTNLDIAAGGVNDSLAQKITLQNVKPLAVQQTGQLLKLVVYVPQSHVEDVRTAMADAGAGHIGQYSHCSFQTAGTGTFLPLAGTDPYIGKAGQLEKVDEVRLETVLPEAIKSQVLAAMFRAHPYEEVAYDLYGLLNPDVPLGLGRIGDLPHEVSMTEFICLLKQALAVSFVKVAGQYERMVGKVAVCGGSGAGLIAQAVAAGADVLVTGDVKYHEAQAAIEAGLTVVDAGHFATEQPVVADLAVYLTRCATENKWFVEIEAGTGCSKDVFDFF